MKPFIIINATEELFRLVEELNNHLQKNFSDNYLKIILSSFSDTAILTSNNRRKRDRIDSDIPCETYSNRSNCTNSQSSNKTFSIIKPETSTIFTNEYSESVATEFPSTTERGSTNTLLTKSYSVNDSSSNNWSIFSTLFPVSKWSTSFFPSTILPPTIVQNTSCTDSMFNNTTKRSLVYLNGTLYFNVTINQTITVKMITDALKSFTPSIQLIDKCRRPSSGLGIFNITLSKIEVPFKVLNNSINFANESSIPASVLNAAQGVVIPDSAFETNTTAAPTPSTTLETITKTTTISTTSSTVPIVVSSLIG